MNRSKISELVLQLDVLGQNNGADFTELSADARGIHFGSIKVNFKRLLSVLIKKQPLLLGSFS